MKRIKLAALTLTVVALMCLLAVSAQAQRTYRAADSQMKPLLARIDDRANAFKSDLGDALNHSKLDGTKREDETNKEAENLQASADRLKQDFDAHRSTRIGAEDVLAKAQSLNTFMRNHRLNKQSQSDWQSLRTDLNYLAHDYYIAWHWNEPMHKESAAGPNNRAETRTQYLINQLESRITRFSNDMPPALARSSWNGTPRQDEIKRMVNDFDYSANQLKQRFKDDTSTPMDIETVLQRAAPINSVMMQHNLDYKTEQDWRMVQRDLEQLASANNVAWNWSDSSPLMDTSALHLTGTYRLNQSLSDNPRTTADRVIQKTALSYGERQTIYNTLIERLQPPEIIAIDQNGNEITLASTRSPQVTFEANGTGNVALYPDGTASHVQATLMGDQLKVDSTGYQPATFNATFQPVENGERLLVTRKIYSERLNSPMVVRSYYNRISDVAELDTLGPGYGDRVSGDFIIPNYVTMTAVLNKDLGSQSALNNERFTMTVTQPDQDRGAIIEGYLSAVEQAGRFNGRPSMTLNFDRIRMADGMTYDFAGTLENVQPANGEDIRINNENAIATENSETKTTLQRTAIDSAVGALVGAVAGGGKGGAIGTVIGAGAAAGSVYVEGRNSFDLPSGSNLTVLASEPVSP